MAHAVALASTKAAPPIAAPVRGLKQGLPHGPFRRHTPRAALWPQRRTRRHRRTRRRPRRFRSWGRRQRRRRLLRRHPGGRRRASAHAVRWWRRRTWLRCWWWRKTQRRNRRQRRGGWCQPFLSRPSSGGAPPCAHPSHRPPSRPLPASPPALYSLTRQPTCHTAPTQRPTLRQGAMLCDPWPIPPCDRQYASVTKRNSEKENGNLSAAGLLLKHITVARRFSGLEKPLMRMGHNKPTPKVPTPCSGNLIEGPVATRPKDGSHPQTVVAVPCWLRQKKGSRTLRKVAHKIT